MTRSFWRFLTITVGGAFAVVVTVYAFNLWAFSYIPHLSMLLSLNDALFLEGILVLVLGISIFLSTKPSIFGGRRMLFLGSSYWADDIKTRKDTAAFGLALIAASITLFSLYFWGIY